MEIKRFEMGTIDIAWCPGCGDYGILRIVKTALAELEIGPEQTVIVSGIGQAAKIPHYLRCNFFNGLHGRALPPATAIKASNPKLTVIAEGGDGDMYGEGGNHFIHTIRRNPNITNIVHNNMVYGLTKGQASPTSRKDFQTPVQVQGVINEPFNPLAVAIALDASFVARGFSGEFEKTKELVKRAIQHQGYALVDIFQPCVSFNKVNTHAWFRENTYWLDDTHNPNNRSEAFAKATEEMPFPLGVFYTSPPKPSFEQAMAAYATDKMPIVRRHIDRQKLAMVMQSFR